MLSLNVEWTDIMKQPGKDVVTISFMHPVIRLQRIRENLCIASAAAEIRIKYPLIHVTYFTIWVNLFIRRK